MQADDMELSLELSIGGCYKSLEKQRKQGNEAVQESGNHQNDENNASSRSDFSEGYVGCVLQDQNVSPEATDPQRKREIQALRRREAIRKREEKQKKTARSKGMVFSGGGGASSSLNGLIDEKFYLEMQKFQARAQDRDTKENENNTAELKRGKGKENDAAKWNMNGAGEDLSLNQTNGAVCVGAFGHASEISFLERRGLNGEKERKLFQPVASRCLRPCQNGNSSGDLSYASSLGCGGLEHRNQKMVSNGSLERTSSAFLDYQSTSQKGGSSSTDTGSHSNYSQGCRQQLIATATSNNTLESPELNGSISQVESNHANGKTANFLVKMTSSNGATPELPNSQKRDPVKNTPTAQERASSSSKGSNEAVIKPPVPQSNGSTPLARMPLVSTTGNGPNGKTVKGFLYRYSKAEVSIVCVCHGRSFSPAEFVEHAGGIDISHPLRHITIIPTTFS